jgi:hypothetical protein
LAVLSGCVLAVSTADEMENKMVGMMVDETVEMMALRKGVATAEDLVLIEVADWVDEKECMMAASMDMLMAV